MKPKLQEAVTLESEGCPFTNKCVSKPEELPNCIKDYQSCVVYEFYKNLSDNFVRQTGIFP
jgi:hypothetical protein